jgi:hypothetical protein
VRRAPTFVLVLLGAIGVAACGSDQATKGVNAPCTRTSDCQSGLSCVAGLCAAPDSGMPPDAGSDSKDAGGDASSPG